MDYWRQAFHEGNDDLQRLLRHTNMKWNSNRSIPPVKALDHEPDEMEHAMSKLNWLRKVEEWLWHLVLHIEDSLDKKFDELSAWNKKFDHLNLADRVNCGIHSSEDEEQKIDNWKGWVDLQDCMENCTRTSSFSGGYYIPKVDGLPTRMQMEHISKFFNYQHSEMVKHYEHLKYLHELITQTLLVDVGNKIAQLTHQIDVLEMLVPDNDIVSQPLSFPVTEEPQPSDPIEDEFWIFSEEEMSSEEDYEVEEVVTEPSGARG